MPSYIPENKGKQIHRLIGLQAGLWLLLEVSKFPKSQSVSAAAERGQGVHGMSVKSGNEFRSQGMY